MATDEQLIEQIQVGKSETYGQLFGKYYQQIYSICFSILKNSHDAEEVTSETFVHAYLKLDQLRKPSQFFFWLKRIAQNRSKNFLRDKPTETIPLDLASAHTTAQIAPDVLLLKHELIDAIMEAIESLPPKDREVIRAHIDGLNHSQISEQLGISIEASKSRLYRVRKKITGYVKDLLNAIVFLPKMPPFKKIVSGGVELMKIGTSTEVTTSIITATQSLMFSVILHITLFIALSFFLPYKFHSDRREVDTYLEVSLLPPAEEQQPAPRPSKGATKSVVSVKKSFPPTIKKASPSKAPRGFLSAKKLASQGEMGETISKMGQGMFASRSGSRSNRAEPDAFGLRRELQIGAGVSVKDGERILSGGRKGEEIVPTVGVGGESVSEVGKDGVGLADGVGEIAKGRGGVDLEMRKVKRLKPVIPQREKFGRQAGLSMPGDIGAADADDTLANVAKDMIMDQSGFGVPKLPKGEPGGIVIGRGKDIRGYLRFPRVDCSMTDREITAIFFSKAILNLMKWINSQTNIKVDINVEGGGIQLADSNLFKSPIVFLFGMDSLWATSTGKWQDWSTFTVPLKLPHPRISNRLTEIERKRLRKYLIDKRGLLIIDVPPKTVRGGEYPWSRRMKRELKTILPEYRLEKIPNNHELYHSYYELGGPPPGPSFSKPGFAKYPTYLEGIFISGRLSVIYSEMWYAYAMVESVMGDKYYPQSSTYRLIVNIIVYALTHGGISDHSKYVPEKEIPEEVPKKAPFIPQPTPNVRP